MVTKGDNTLNSWIQAKIGRNGNYFMKNFTKLLNSLAGAQSNFNLRLNIRAINISKARRSANHRLYTCTRSRGMPEVYIPAQEEEECQRYDHEQHGHGEPSGQANRNGPQNHSARSHHRCPGNVRRAPLLPIAFVTWVCICRGVSLTLE